MKRVGRGQVEVLEGEEFRNWNEKQMRWLNFVDAKLGILLWRHTLVVNFTVTSVSKSVSLHLDWPLSTGRFTEYSSNNR